MNIEVKQINPKDFIFFLAIAMMFTTSFILNQGDYITEFIYRQQGDEKVYHNIVQNWNEKGITSTIGDNKPIFFLYLQKFLDGDFIKTRILAIILIFFNTYLIYKITNRKLALIYPFFYFFLVSIWLTVEVIEAMFLLLMFTQKKQLHQGFFVGVATFFRPYALFYSVLLKKKSDFAYVITFLLFFILALYSFGLLQSYPQTLFNYATNSNEIGKTFGVSQESFDYPAMVVLFLLILSQRNKEYARWGYVSLIPLALRQFGHYFITPYSIFFLAYLKDDKNE